MPFINQAAISTGGVTVSQNTDLCILQQVDEQQWQQMNVKAQVIWLGTKLQLENITTTEHGPAVCHRHSRRLPRCPTWTFWWTAS